MGLPIPEPAKPSTPTPSSKSARRSMVARDAGIAEEDAARAAARARPRPRPGRRNDARAAAEARARGRASASSSSRGATARRVAQLYPLVDPLMSNMLALPPAPRRPRPRSSARPSAAAGRCPARARWRSASPTWWASPASARKCRRTSSGASPRAWKRSRCEVATPPVRLVKTIGDARDARLPSPRRCWTPPSS